jgi:hypothetical protein
MDPWGYGRHSTSSTSSSIRSRQNRIAKMAEKLCKNEAELASLRENVQNLVPSHQQMKYKMYTMM